MSEKDLDRRACDKNCEPIKGLRNMQRVLLTILLLLFGVVITMPLLASNDVASQRLATSTINAEQNSRLSSLEHAHHEMLKKIETIDSTNREILRGVGSIEGYIRARQKH